MKEFLCQSMISTNLEQVQGVVGATQEWGWRGAFLIKRTSTCQGRVHWEKGKYFNKARGGPATCFYWYQKGLRIGNTKMGKTGPLPAGRI